LPIVESYFTLAEESINKLSILSKLSFKEDEFRNNKKSKYFKDICLKSLGFVKKIMENLKNRTKLQFLKKKNLNDNNNYYEIENFNFYGRGIILF
jgi:hypothetical protein